MMDNYNVFVGGLSGVFKGFKVSQNKGVQNVKNLQKLKEITERNEVTALSWADKLENEILVGYQNQLVKIFDLNSNTFTQNEKKSLGEGPICGLFNVNRSLVTAVESGLVKVWAEKETVVDTGGPLTRMRQNPCQENIIGTGGKENDLKLWDLETGKHVFQAKNVRHDELELRVPVWVMDLSFLPNGKQVAAATRYGHVRLYDPSTPTRRPVCQVTAKDLCFTSIANAPRENHVVVGCTTGNMYLIDLRGKGLLLNQYRGFMGSVRQVACPTTEPYILSVSLDRHFRVHHLDSKKLLVKEYMQSRLSALLLKSSFTMEDIKDEPVEIKEEDEGIHVEDVDEEYEQMFDEMEVVEEEPNGETKKKSKPSRRKGNPRGNESEEEHEELFDNMDEVTEKTHKAGKRSKTATSSKKKRPKPDNQNVITVN